MCLFVAILSPLGDFDASLGGRLRSTRECHKPVKVLVKFLASMKHTNELLSSFDTSWTGFSKSWKKARAKASEKSVHDLRVGTRRLIATLELTRVLSKRAEISKLQRRFKKVLKGMGPLRDVQVQLENVAHMRQKTGLILDFK